MGEVCALIDNAHNLKFNFTVFIGNYNTDNLRLIYYSGSLENLYDSNFLIASNNNIANFTFIYDCENRNMNFNPISSILTYKNQVNYLFITLSSSSVKLDLGIGKNLTAYYDATNKNIIYVYMKVGDKMVKKTVQITTVTEDDTTTKTAEIIEQKVIGTYDYYFETPSEKYIVVKDDQLYVFK